MAPAVKGDPSWDEDFLALLEAAQTKFVSGWKNTDYPTAQRAHEICVYMLPRLFAISHMRGKQGHGRR